VAAPSDGAGYALRIDDEAAFRRLARTYHSGDLADMPHVLFVIERAKGRAFYADGAAFDFHGSFARALGLTTKANREFFAENYTTPARPLILGTIVRQPRTDTFYFEFSDADRIDASIVRETRAVLSKSFYAPLVFRANSLAHEELLPSLADMKTTASDSLRNPTATAVHRKGQATGVLRLGTDADALDLAPDSIALFKTAPVSVAPVRGLIVDQASSPLSHLHMLARMWKVPDVTQPDAATKWGALVGKWVTLVASGTRFVTLREATAAEIERSRVSAAPDAVKLVFDLDARALTDLHALRRADGKRVGAKAAQLGEITAIAGVKVPPGFAVPFAYYRDHLRSSGARELAERGLAPGGALHDPARRKEALEALRKAIEAAPVDAAFARSVTALYDKRFPERGVFVRSSTNAEDLPTFNGAGLYTTVPNVHGGAAVVDAIKTVWASVWNLEAFEAREAAGIPHLDVYAGVLVQLGVDAESAGVLISRNPFNAEDADSVYINAKRGLGIRVVNGHKIPEQLLFSARTGGIKVLSRSDEETELKFAAGGGVKEQPIAPGTTPRVLTRPLVKQLVHAANAIEKRFGGIAMDVEWVVEKGQAYIVQGRPYLE
jgi:hypothetical protein